MTLREVPALAAARKLKLPKTAERTLANGLTVIAARRPAVPLVEVRLRVPFARTNVARGMVLAETMLSGTSELSNVELSTELQRIGGGLTAAVDPDRLLLGGNALSSGLGRLLDLLGLVLSDATYPSGEVAAERDRLADQVRVAKTQPAYLARAALNHRMYGRHPYARQTAEPEQLAAVRPAALRSLHAERVHPAGAILVIVGDVPPAKALDAAEAALSTWNGGGKSVELPAVPGIEPGPVTLADRPGSVQSSLRIGLGAVGRTHPDHSALQLANLIYGGYFSSRLVENIREAKGYTYSPRSSIEHSAAGSSVVVSADVATEVTAPALVETWYELGRLVSTPVGVDELEQARQYGVGTLQLSLATQSGLAGLMSSLSGSGLRLDWLTGHAERMAAASVEAVTEVAERYFAPANAATVVLGDASVIEPSLTRLFPVTRAENGHGE
ncbi:M16 family metallopeptidase [Actinocatenispora rupis]|uniref:Peptidase M16 n=1 Tax=Actinocatenispora rupis TaxID=519421 RepID=A0A8J3J5Q6_9ACTN|nr:pitrilysin family protein [Actinocatenispora rupis]GID15240.1 peptidase M16 [Actinocatenispora rupis]